MSLRGPGSTARVWPAAMALACLALALAVWAPGPTVQTADEFVWLYRSDGFRNAVTTGDFAGASAGRTGPKSTMPGVTTMWAGTVGHALAKSARRVGLVDRAGPATRLRASRAVVASWCAIALGLLVLVGSLLVGRRAAVIAGALLATEPFLVGHSGVLHTDAMVTMFGALSVVALAAALWGEQDAPPLAQPRKQAEAADGGGRPVSRALLALSAASAGLALLTKLNAAPLVVGGAAVVLGLDVAFWSHRRSGGSGPRAGSVRRSAGVAVAWSAMTAAVGFVLWPALWVRPGREYHRVVGALDQAGSSYRIFFWHHVRHDAGPGYYPVAMVFRFTPWLALGAGLAVLWGIAHLVIPQHRRRWDRRANVVLGALLLAPLPYVAVLSVRLQKYDRYVLPVVPYLALLIGVGVADVIRRAQDRRADQGDGSGVGVDSAGGRLATPRAIAGAGLILTGLLALYTLRLAPYALAYVDPLAGGQRKASQYILLGWGEGIEVAGAEICRREGRHPVDVRVAGVYPTSFMAVPCGERQVASGASAGDVDYVVRTITDRQKELHRSFYDDVRRRGRLIRTVAVQGLTYVELWKVERR